MKQPPFLVFLYRKWPGMFFVVLLFVAGQLFFTIKKVESLPWFLSTMYSTPHQTFDTSVITAIHINGQPFDTRSLVTRESELLLGSLGYYQLLREMNFHATDSATIARRFERLPAPLFNLFFDRLTNRQVTDKSFQQWWLRYLEQVSGTRVDSATLLQYRIAWIPHYHVLPDTLTLATYVKQP